MARQLIGYEPCPGRATATAVTARWRSRRQIAESNTALAGAGMVNIVATVRAALLPVISSAFRLNVGIPLCALDLAMCRSFDRAGNVP
jgi:hypothetical protein